MAGRPRLLRLALLLLSTALALLVAEVALRAAGVSYPNFYRPDPVRGWSLRPGSRGWWTKEGRAYVRISSAGLRDQERPLAKPPGELRIAVLGDSCAEALQVPAERTFWALLERELAACPAVAGRRVEALDFGVSGYGTAQELLTLESEAWKYDPDVVLLAFYTGNDVRNNHRPLEQDPLRPYFELRDGRLVRDDSFRQARGYRLRQTLPARLLYGLFDRSRLLQLGKRAKGTLDGWVGRWRASRVEARPAAAELGLDDAVYARPATPEWRDAWAVTEALVRRMAQEVEARGAAFALATLTNGAQVHPDPRARRNFQEKLGVDTLFYPEERLRALGEKEGFPVLALAPPLARHAERTGRFLHGFPNTAPGEGHWNPEGHWAAARLLAAWLCREVLGEGPGR